ncbi:hypothetical protein PFICI_02936 [Pestalotiopsis fici W106-1]|uniref:Uncharacterized protein n=1 Tax=Pestalotiopsis fici (strain W106-1 / CGMCC3.15140) TaxID=1229662 RepID=W3XI41_PESFW|nr:uncharacterized protein PFICI_02936 [Pestalotiopsis fici W106-1]ETS84911.1 hypothetical protein PFICI_02936 [Pestalotiopsis fici W106-1]
MPDGRERTVRFRESDSSSRTSPRSRDSGLAQDYDVQRFNVGALQEALDSCREEKGRYKSKANDLDAQLTAFRSTLREKELEIRSLREENATLRHQRDTYEIEVHDLRRRLAPLSDSGYATSMASSESSDGRSKSRSKRRQHQGQDNRLLERINTVVYPSEDYRTPRGPPVTTRGFGPINPNYTSSPSWSVVPRSTSYETTSQFSSGDYIPEPLLPKPKVESKSSSSRKHQSRVSTLLPIYEPILRQIPQPIPQRFQEAINRKDLNSIAGLLRESFDEVASGAFAWIDELRQLGLSLDVIAQELVEESSDSPWIFSDFDIPSSPSFKSDFHVENCLCADRHSTTRDEKALLPTLEANESLFLENHISEVAVEDIIDILCGLGGVRPSVSDDRTLDLGHVEFDAEISRGTVLYHTQGLEETLTRVLDHLSVAAGSLQQVGGCCNKFTYLSISSSATEVHLHSLDLQVIRDLRSQIATPNPEDISRLLPGFSFVNGGNDEIPAPLLLSIVVQFLSTALLSYSRAHCGPISPAFLDRGVDQIMLLGAAERTNDYDGPCILGSLVNLACFGDMLGQPAFAFRYYSRISEAKSTITSKEKHNLIASPCDLLDTWGPGQLISASDDHEVIHAIYVGGGCITATGQDASRALLHWSREPRLEELPQITFSRSQKAVIGAWVTVNASCEARQQDPLRSASVFLHELGTYRDYWEKAERQLGFGLQAGQSPIAALQLNQTWVKMRGLTKKSRMLARLYKSDFEELYSVQISVCTGVARRVSLRKMLADLLSTYVAALISEPPLWSSLVEDFDIITALESKDLGQWAAALPHDHQKTFECLVIAVLTSMRDTGIDRKGENLVIGCIQPGIAFQCFQVPCTKENYWARMLADSDEVATFAYITMDCLETSHLKCRAPSSLWANSTGLFWTAVACCEQQSASSVASPVQGRWELRHSETYIMGAVDTPLLVKVDRPNQAAEPRLLVSVSLIQSERLKRLFWGTKIGHKRRLRERRVLDPVAEEVFVLVGKRDVSTLTS